MGAGTVVSIHIAPDAAAPMVPLLEVRAVEGRGLEGDRYFLRRGTAHKKERPIGPDREVTLIESEAVEAAARDYGVAVPPGEIRRNLVTRGVALNHLVGREFSVGSVRLKGLRLSEPCGHMEGLVGKKGIREALVHRGGLRAQILVGGLIRVGDPVMLE